MSPQIPENVDSHNASTIEAAMEQVIEKASTLIQAMDENGKKSVDVVGDVCFVSNRRHAVSLEAELDFTEHVVTANHLLEAYKQAKEEHELDYNQFLTGAYD